MCRRVFLLLPNPSPSCCIEQASAGAGDSGDGAGHRSAGWRPGSGQFRGNGERQSVFVKLNTLVTESREPKLSLVAVLTKLLRHWLDSLIVHVPTVYSSAIVPGVLW